MKFLLDTHYLIWCIANSNKLPKKVRALITDRKNDIFVSTVSLWEIALKTVLKKLVIEGFTPGDLPAICAKLDIQIEKLSAEESSSFYLLKTDYHKDPFDRMLIWQAITKEYTLVTGDETIKRYESEGLKVF